MTESSGNTKPEVASINLNKCRKDESNDAMSSRSGNGGLGKKRTYKELERWDV